MKTAKTERDVLVELVERAQARQAIAKPRAKKDWFRTAGWAKDDPIFEEAMTLGAAWRKGMDEQSLLEGSIKDAHP
jgi:hypothetical protein